MHKARVKPKELGGSERIILDKKDLDKVEKYAAYLTLEEIADYFGICRRVFFDIRQRQPEVSAHYQKGKIKKNLIYAEHLEDKALGKTDKGDTTALIFYLKTRARWSEAVPEVKVEEQIIETPEEKAARMEDIKLFTQWKKERLSK